MKNKSYHIQNARLWLRRVLPSIMFVILAHNFAVAQPAEIFLKTTVTVKTRLGGVTEKEVFTEHGRFLLRDISRITFWEEAPDSAKIVMLRTHGIVVFRKMEQLATIKPKDTELEYHSIGSIGFGFGLDYGGIGIRATLLPAGPISFFGGFGSYSYNVGAEWKFRPHKRTTGFLSAMYGYNAVLDRTITSPDRTIFYGASVGLGVKMPAFKSDKNYLNFQIIYPFREEAIKQAPIGTLVYPILFSLGLHVGF